MGYAVPRRKYSFEPEAETREGHAQPIHNRSELSRSPVREQPTVTPNSASSRTLSGPRADGVELEQSFSTRELMPPPPLPRQRPPTSKFSPFRQPTLLPAMLPSETRNSTSQQAELLGFPQAASITRDFGARNSHGLHDLFERTLERRNSEPFREGAHHQDIPLQHRSSHIYTNGAADNVQYSDTVRTSLPISVRKGRDTDRVSEIHDFRYHDPKSSSRSSQKATNNPGVEPRNPFHKSLQPSNKRPFSYAESVTSPFFKRTTSVPYSRTVSKPTLAPQNNGLHQQFFSCPQLERHEDSGVSQEPWFNLRSTQQNDEALHQLNHSNDGIIPSRQTRRSDRSFTGSGGHVQLATPYRQFHDSKERLGTRPNLFSRPIATPIPSTPSIRSSLPNPQYTKQAKPQTRNQLGTSHKSGILWPSEQFVRDQAMPADVNTRGYFDGHDPRFQQIFAERPRRSVRR